MENPRQKIKSIKNPIKHLFIFNFYFIKSETSDSFVNHFDGHFAYLKTLDFYFKPFPFSPHQHVKGFPPERTVPKVDLLQGWKIYCLRAGVCVCTFEPGNFTGWGSEWVNSSLVHSRCDVEEGDWKQLEMNRPKRRP